MKYVLLLLVSILSVKSASLNVLDYGAVGDARGFICNTVSNSSDVVVTSSAFSAGDVGKLVQIFAGGPVTSGLYHQDYIGRVTQVNGNTVTLSNAPMATITGATGTIGTENRAAFQSAIDALASTDDEVVIPNGRFLIVSEFQLSTNEMSSVFDMHAALTLSRGGVTFRGDSGAVLLGCGAWQLKPWVHRGTIFQIKSVTNDYPLVFDNLTFDGGVLTGLTSVVTWPANTTTGLGWDVTHDAISDRAPLPNHSLKTFKNCTFQKWRGEILKSNVATTNGFLVITNCVFQDGNASAMNYVYSHRISNCRFDGLILGMELYQGYMKSPSFFENSVITNVVNALVIVGALTNSVEPLYTISGNSISASTYGMEMAPARNLLITSNTFFGKGITTSGASVQGDDYNGDWTVSFNVFTNMAGPCFINASYSDDRTSNIVFYANRSYGANQFGTGFGVNYTTRFTSNVMAGGNLQYAIDSRALTGQYFFDDGTNDFPPYFNNDAVGITNVVSYNLGAIQTTHVISSVTNAVFALDDSSPDMIPDGALLVLTHTGIWPAQYRTSTATNGKRMLMQDGDTRTFYWRGGKWKDSRLGFARIARVGQIK